SKYRLDPNVLPAEKVDALGIEEVPPEAKAAAAGEAYRRAKAGGVDVLPPPEVGQPYNFSLRTIDGKLVRARDFRGKVVLIDGWASWCTPCMGKMPALKALYEKRHQDGFEWVGVCYDQEPASGTCGVQCHRP